MLAKVDDVTITVGEFQERINQQSPYVRARYTSMERKKEFLDNLVRFEVLAKEADRRGLTKDPEVVRTMKQVMIQKLLKDRVRQAAHGGHHRRRVQEVLRRAPRAVQQARGGARLVDPGQGQRDGEEGDGRSAHQGRRQPAVPQPRRRVLAGSGDQGSRRRSALLRRQDQGRAQAASSTRRSRSTRSATSRRRSRRSRAWSS